MYFTKEFRKAVFNKILKNEYEVYAIKLRTGLFSDDEEELVKIIDAMFVAWHRMTREKNKNYIRNYKGLIKRLVFEYKKETDSFSPIFYLFCVRKKLDLPAQEEYKNRVVVEKIKVQTYIRWFSTWASALKMCSPVSVGFSLVELENLEKVLGEFCTNEKYTLFPLIDEAKRSLLKKASGDGKHKLVTFGGIFKNMNRQMTVER